MSRPVSGLPLPALVTNYMAKKFSETVGYFTFGICLIFRAALVLDGTESFGAAPSKTYYELLQLTFLTEQLA